MKGHFTPHTEETKRKISESRKGKGLGYTHGFKKSHVPWNKGKEMSAEHRLKLSVASKGKGIGNQNAKGNILSQEVRGQMGQSKLGNKYAFKHGLTPKNVLIRMSKSYAEWRKAVFERDNYTCQKCGDRSEAGNRVVLNADHILPFATFPESRLDIDNGRTLCVPCHRKTSTFGSKALVANKIST